jgi:hypothetical protein
MKKIERKIEFYHLIKFDTESNEEFTKCEEIVTISDEVLKEKVLKRIYDISSNKFCYLDSYAKKGNNYDFIFVTGNNQTRADLVHRRTGQVRSNPKELAEGEQEKTHVVMRFNGDVTQLIVEKNRNGLNKFTFSDYFNFMNRRYFKDSDIRFKLNPQVNKGFLEEMMELKRVKVAEVYIDKRVLGNDFLNLSNRITPVKNELVLKITSDTKEDIKSVATDLYNKVSSGKSTVHRLRLHGFDDFKNEKILDTLNAFKKYSLTFDVNENNGQINSQNAFIKLRGLFIHFD